MSKESVGRTLTVATGLCLVCSILVSSASVLLSERQKYNMAIDLKRNMLVAAGLIQEQGDTSSNAVERAFSNVGTSIIDLNDFKIHKDDPNNPFNQRKAVKSADSRLKIDSDDDFASIRFRSKKVKLYYTKSGGKLDLLILPVHGRGLWSTLYGFLIIGSDLNTVKGLSFYEHGETPGLGGEVDNPRWKAIWKGKKIYQDGNVALKVIKGTVAKSDKMASYQVDGLSGATITSVGVSNIIKYWMGPQAFGPLLEKIKKNEVAL